MENLNTREKAVFVAERWLDKHQGVQCELLPAAGGALERHKYKVTVKTSDDRGSGTDKDISIVLLGSSGAKSAELKLDNSSNNFERNATDVFLLDLGLLDLGRLSGIEIGFAAKQSLGGLLASLTGAAWGLSHVEVEHVNTGERIFFVYRGWVNGTKPRVQLVPSSAEELAKAQKAPYKIVVRTSDLRGAGTDANVDITLFGKDASGKMVDSGPIRLDSSANDFERGRTDTFDISCRPVGELAYVQVRKDNAGVGSDWHLQDVTVTDLSSGRSWFFPCNKWFENKSPASLCQDLPAGNSDGSVGESNMVEYLVSVLTADERGAGTDSDCFIQLFGKDGSICTSRMPLHGKLERGCRDDLVLRGVDVGEVVEIEVGHNNSGPGPAWKLAAVEVLNPTVGRPAVFTLNDWIQGPRTQRTVSRRIRAGEAGKTGSALANQQYRIEVATSDIRFAGTDSDVYVTVLGDKGDSGERRLVDRTKSNMFERASTDTVLIECGSLGELQGLVVRTDHRLAGSDWHLDHIRVTDMLTGKQWGFPFRDWLNKKNGFRAELMPDRDGDGFGDAGTLKLIEYQVSVVTSSQRGAGTDADVRLTLKGQRGTLGPNLLRKSETNSNPFERGQTDVFTLHGSDIGMLVAAEVQLHGGGMTADWHLASIEVLNKGSGERAFFHYNNWFNKTLTPDWRAVLHAAASSADPGVETSAAATPEHVFQVEVLTGSDKGAGTNDRVFLQLFGPGDRPVFAQPQELTAKGRNLFEAGQTDSFLLAVKPDADPLETAPGSLLSLLERVVLEKRPGIGFGGDWQLSTLTLVDTRRGHSFEWSALHLDQGWLKGKGDGAKREWSRARWLDGRDEAQGLKLVAGDQHLPARAGAPGAAGAVAALEEKFLLEVKTSDKIGAGTDAEVFVQFEDDAGVVWEPVLKQDKARYERNSKDEDVLVMSGARLLGDHIRSCRVWHKGQGLFNRWHLAYIRLRRLRDQRQWIFECNDVVHKAAGASGATVLMGRLEQEGQKKDQGQEDGGGGAAAIHELRFADLHFEQLQDPAFKADLEARLRQSVLAAYGATAVGEVQVDFRSGSIIARIRVTFPAAGAAPAPATPLLQVVQQQMPQFGAVGECPERLLCAVVSCS